VAGDPLHTAYCVYQKDDALMVVNTNVCHGADPAGCATLVPPEIHTGASPEMVRLDQQTQTLYTANEVDNDVSVIDARRCDAQTTKGCRPRGPEDRIPPGALAADPAVATTYVANGADTVSMIDTTTCNAYRRVGCNATPPTVTVGTNPAAVAVDPRTHTAYVASFGAGPAGMVAVLDDRTCNSTDQGGCSDVATLNVPGGNPDDIAVNPRTDTIYVARSPAAAPTSSPCSTAPRATPGTPQVAARRQRRSRWATPATRLATPSSTWRSTKRRTRSTRRTRTTPGSSARRRTSGTPST
jgi:hypothetical protein